MTFALVVQLSVVLAMDCKPQWDNAPGMPGMDQTVRALQVFDDGSGAGPMLYAGGSFTVAGGEPASSIARWNGKTWEEVGGGINGPVRAMAVFNNALYVGGLFTQAGDVAAHNIVKWDGQQWSPLAGGTSGNVRAMAVFNNALHVGGQFLTAGGVSANRIARWNGFQWSPLGSGTNERVDAMTVFDGGNGPALYVGGEFTTAGPINAQRIARWNGSAWSNVGVGGANARIWAMTVIALTEGQSQMIVGGDFVTLGGQSINRIAAWNGQAWSPLATGVNDTVRALTTLDFGNGVELIAGGDFSIAGQVDASNIARWDGRSWHPLGSGTVGSGENVRSLTGFNDGVSAFVYAGGQFSHAGSLPAVRIARWGCVLSNALPGDLNGDGAVDGLDLLILLSAWGICPDPTPGNCPADLNEDGSVDGLDLLILLSNWG